MNLSQKRIFLTGGSGGLGRPLAAELVSAGAEVTVVSRRPGDKSPAARHIAADLSTDLCQVYCLYIRDDNESAILRSFSSAPVAAIIAIVHPEPKPDLCVATRRSMRLFSRCAMSASERLLSPKCLCGRDMRLSAPRTMRQRHETHIQVYHCADCDHEMRVTVWGADVQAA